MARLELELDGSGIRRGVTTAKSELSEVKREATQAEAALDRLSKSGSQDAAALASATQRVERAQDAVRRSTERLAAAQRSAGGAAAQFANSQAQVARAAGAGRLQLQNASFQIGDFATQVGAGTSASVALGQQLPQLLGGFGVLGAVMGAVVAIGVPLTRVLFGSADAAKDFGEAIGDLEGAVNTASRSLDEQAVSLSELIDEYGALAERVQEVREAQTRVDLGQQVESLSDAIEAIDPGPLEEAIDLLGQFTDAPVQTLAVQGLRQEFEALPRTLQDAARSYAALFEADTPEEQAKLATQLRQELESLGDTKFNGLIAQLTRLEQSALDVLKNVSKQGAETEFVGRGDAGPGGPALDSTDAEFLRRTGSVPSDEVPARQRENSATDEIDKQAQAYERLRAQLDPTFRAQNEHQNSVDALNAALEAGSISQQQYNDTLALADERFAATSASGQQFFGFLNGLASGLVNAEGGLTNLVDRLGLTGSAAEGLAQSIAALGSARGPTQITAEIDNLIQGLIESAGGVENLDDETLEFIGELRDAQQEAASLANVLGGAAPEISNASSAMDGLSAAIADSAAQARILMNALSLAATQQSELDRVTAGGPDAARALVQNDVGGELGKRIAAEVARLSAISEDSSGGPSGGAGGGTAAAEIGDLADAYERLRASVDPAFSAQVEYNEALETLNGALAEGKISQEEYTDTLALVKSRLDDATRSSDGLARASAQLAEITDPNGQIVEAASSLQGALSDFLFNPFEVGVLGMVNQFATAIQRMTADALAAQAVQGLLGLFGGGWSMVSCSRNLR